MPTWKPDKARLSDQISLEVKGRIIDGVYPAGSRLPPERDLAEELGVTRLTLREALKLTEQAGFTETRHGSGTFVIDIWRHGTLHVLGEILLAQRQLGTAEIRSLLEFRRIVVPGFAESIVKQFAPRHLDALRDIARREAAAVADKPMMVDLEYEFQETLADASANHIYMLLVKSVRPAYSFLCKIVYDAVDDLSSVVEAHESMIEAIETKDAPRLQQELTDFVVCGNELIEHTLPKEGSSDD